MPIQMKVDREKIKIFPPADAGWKILRLVKFGPKQNKAKDGINFNPQFEIENCPPDRNKVIFHSMSDKFPQAILDICHGLGFPLDAQDNLPGGFEGNPQDMTTWQYKGPLMGKTLEAECVEREYNGNKSLNIKSVKCKVPGCTEKHSTNLVGKN